MRKPQVWSALCTAIADGSDARYPLGAKHAIIFMVRASELQAGESVLALLISNGWRGPEITQMKQLEDPFRSEDPVMLSCYKGATHKEGGLIVYSETMENNL